MEFNQFIKSFPIRTDIFDDITYLQKHLRLYIKFHQKLSARLYIPDTNYDESMKPSRSFHIIREHMDILEAEMEDISKEQKMLTNIVKKSINQYCDTLLNESNIAMDKDVANGFVTRALQFHYQKRCFNIMPSNVKTRWTEDELKHKYEEIRSKIFNERERATTDKFTSPSTATATSTSHQESLLKPKFRKPSSGSSGRNDKKPVVRKSIIETRHAKVIQKQNAAAAQQGIKGSRLNLLRALNKVKTEQIDPDCIGDSKKYRSDEDCSDQSSSYDGPIEMEVMEEDPLKIVGRKRKSPVSTASSDSDLMKSLPPLPPEMPPKMDYTQEEFLSIFMLITPQVADEIKAQKTKRKRRNCAKNEKNDFHYGNFDLNEAAFRLRMCNNRRSILYSPNNKRK